MSKASYRYGEPIELTFTLANPRDKPVRVLDWNTPLEGMVGNPFLITYEGKEQRYFGAYGTRSAPASSSYRVVEAHDSLKRTVDLSAAYDLPSQGRYQVRLRYGYLFDIAPARGRLPTKLDGLKRERITSNVITFEMIDAQSRVRQPVAGPRDVQFVGCNSDQQTSILAAMSKLTSDAPAVGGATKPLCEDPPQGWIQSKAATTFFGSGFSTTRCAMVGNVVQGAVTDAKGLIIFDCETMGCGTLSCSQGYVAITCGSPTIYLCSEFFDLETSGGVPTQESVIFHELTHWVGTKDYAYGCSACEGLAEDDPDQAADNADNYSYFYGFVVTSNNPCGLEHALAALLVLLILLLGRRLYLAGAIRHEPRG